MTTPTPVTVRVTAKHIRDSEPGDCYRCAVTLALAEAIGEDDVMVDDRDFVLHICVGDRWMVCPWQARRFIYAYDALDRDADGRVVLPAELAEDLAPFEFELPGLNGPAWQEACYRCEALFDPDELDGAGSCPECRENR